MKKKHIVATALVVLLLAAASIYFFLHSRGNEVLLRNEASEGVIKATVEIGPQKFEFGPIAPGESRRIKFKVEGDAHYKVVVEFHYERKLETQLGHLTKGLHPKDQLIIKDDVIVLETGGE